MELKLGDLTVTNVRRQNDDEDSWLGSTRLNGVHFHVEFIKVAYAEEAIQIGDTVYGAGDQIPTKDPYERLDDLYSINDDPGAFQTIEVPEIEEGAEFVVHIFPGK